MSVQEQAELARKTLGAFGLDEVSVSGGGVCDELFVPSAPADRFSPPSPHWKPLPSLATAVDVTWEARRAAAAARAAAVDAAIEAAVKAAAGVGTGVGGGAGIEEEAGVGGGEGAVGEMEGGKGGGGGEGPGRAIASVSESTGVAAAGSPPPPLEIVLQQQEEKKQDQETPPLPPQQLGVFKVEDFVFPGMTRRFRVFEPRYRALVKRCLSEGEPLLILPLSRGGNTVGTAVYVSGLDNVEEDGR